MQGSSTRPNRDRVSINFVGDIMLGDSFHMLGIGVGSALMRKNNPPIFERAAPFLTQADMNVGNLECVVPQQAIDPARRGKPYLMFSPCCVQSLKEAGFGILNMANNHSMQYGKDGFQYTEEILHKHDIRVIGTVRRPYCTVEKGPIGFAFLGYSMRPDQHGGCDIQYVKGDKDKITADVRTLRERHDHIIVSLHWGDEYIDYPDAEQVRLAHDIIDSGAAAVIGHHPHVLQGIEKYGKGVIAYSLGNFVFDKPQEHQRKSVILQAVFSKERLENIKITPVRINDKYQPVVLQDKKRDDIDALMKRLNAKIPGRAFDRARYRRDVRRGLRRMQMRFYFFFISNFHRYPPATFLSLLSGAIRRKAQTVRK